MSVGGELVVTTQRIVSLPWNTADIAGVLTWALPKVGAPRIAGAAVKALQYAVDGARAEITAQHVVAGTDGSLLRPPTVVVEGSDGTRAEFGVLAGPRVPNGSSRSRAARNRFLAAGGVA